MRKALTVHFRRFVNNIYICVFVYLFVSERSLSVHNGDTHAQTGQSSSSHT
jgi:hypothetical protein